MDLQSRLDEAFDNYLAVSNELLADGEMLLKVKESEIYWKRNFIRTSVAIIEGYNNCFRQIAAIGLECEGHELSHKEAKALITGDDFGICERIKYTLRGTYRMFEVDPIPDFGTEGWRNAQEGLDKRHVLMHPKSFSDLEISTESWERIYSGFTWLLEQHFNLIRLLHEKHSKKSN